MKFIKKEKLSLNNLLFAATVLPILFMAAIILRYGVNVPTFDQWELIPYLEKMNAHSLTFGDIIAQHNEHRIAFPRLIMLGLASLTGWNMIAEMLTSLGLQILSFVLIWKAINRTLSGTLAAAVALFASFCLFNPMQWENWLWGWQIQWYLTILGMVAALYFCWYLPLRSRKLNHLVAIVAATVATFSLASGMVTWVLLLAFLAIRKQFKALAVYLAATTGNLALYFHNYHSIAGHTPIDTLFTNQLDFFRYVFLYLGGSISNDDQIAPIIGAITLVLFLILSIKAILIRQSKTYFWIAIASYVLLNAAITGSGRFLLGPEQALASRYTSFSLLWILSLVILSAPYIYSGVKARTEWRQPITIASIAALLAIFTINSLGGVSSSIKHRLKYQTASSCLNVQKTPDSNCFSLVYPSSPEIDKQNREYLTFLRSEHLAGRHTTSN